LLVGSKVGANVMIDGAAIAGRIHAPVKRGRAARSSFSPLATILSASSGKGRCNSRAFGASAASQRSTSAGVVSR